MDLVGFMFGDETTKDWAVWHEKFTQAKNGLCPYRDRCKRYERTIKKHRDMEKETFEKAQAIMKKIERINNEIERVEKTDTIYFRTPDMDGGFTQGQYVKFYEEAKGEIKEALKDYYQKKINELNNQFAAL